MKKIFTLLLSLPLFISAQTVVYDIPIGQLINQGDFCGTGNLYNNCAGDYGFTWTDTGIGSIASVTVEMYQGIGCTGAATPIALNGVNQGNITDNAQCTCSPASFTTHNVSMSPADYVVGGVNQVIITETSCAGFSPNGAWGGAYARVTVDYCFIPDVASLSTVTDECSATISSAPTATGYCGSAVTYDIMQSDLFGLYDGGCGQSPTHLYNFDGATSVDYGFTWTSTGSSTPSSISIEFNKGIDCDGAAKNVALNGVAQGTITGTGQCTCIPTTSTEVLVVNPADYTVGGTNTILISYTASEGLSQNAAWGGAYARVTVNYPSTTITGTTTDPLTYSSEGTYTVTWTYDDGNGNTATQTQTVTVDDVTAPVADAGSLATVTGECSATISSAPTATENCGVSTVTYDIPVGQLINQGDFCGTGHLYNNCAGDYGFTWTSTGTGSIASVTVEMYQGIGCTGAATPVALNGVNQGNITDNGQCTCTPGSFTTHNVSMSPSDYVVGGANQVIITEGSCAGFSPNGAWGGAYARVTVVYDSGPITITGTTTDPLTYSSEGTYTVNWTYDDGNGNTATQTQTVVVDDVTAPVADAGSLATVTGECSATVGSTPTATDNCVGSVTGTTTDPLTYSSEGTYTVNWTYDDGNGNTATQTQTVVVDDVTAPVADAGSLATVTGECSATVGSTPTATDNCVGSVTGTTTDPLTYSSEGTYTVTWTYDDGNGNTATQTQTVIVDDVTAPVADAGTLSDINAACEVTSLTAPTATDNCAGTLTGTTTTPLPITSSTTITWTYADGNGNTSTQTQNVVITSNIDNSISQAGNTLSSNEADATATYQWIDCATNTDITGEINKDFSPTASGSFKVRITKGGCTVESPCFSFTFVGVETQSEQRAKIYPNPASDNVVIELAELHPNTTMTVVDVTGKVVKEMAVTTKRNTINVSEFASGVYFVKITSEQGINTVKFVKK